MWHKQSFTQFWSQSDAYSRRSSLKLTYIHHPLVVCTHQICCAVAVPIALSQDRLLHGHNRLVNWTPCSRMRESKLKTRGYLHGVYGQRQNFISYTLFADADTGIYPHAASQYHARPKAKRGIAMLSGDKFTYPRKQPRGNEFIPCSNNICDILKRFRSFKIPAITLIWPKSPYKHSVTRSYRSGKESRRRSESPLWRHHWRSFVFISHADDVKREIRLHISRLLTNQKRESARSMGYICIYIYVCVCVCVFYRKLVYCAVSSSRRLGCQSACWTRVTVCQTSWVYMSSSYATSNALFKS